LKAFPSSPKQKELIAERAALAAFFARENPTRKRRRRLHRTRKVSRRDGFLVEFLKRRANGKLEFWYMLRRDGRGARITRTRARAKFYESERAAAKEMREVAPRLNRQFKLARVVPA
jgi:hypothetical protein